MTENTNGIVVPADTGIVIRDIQLTLGRGEKRPPYMPPELPADSIPPDLSEG